MRLSPRQQQVFDMIGQGIPNRDIARSLKISPRTTEVHRLHIMRRLGLKSTTELVKAWIWEQLNSETGFCVNQGDLGVHYFLYDDVKKLLGVK